VKIGMGDRYECCSSPILFNFYTDYLNNQPLKGFGDFERGQVIHNVKYADELV
jgi:hypothetical protein